MSPPAAVWTVRRALAWTEEAFAGRGLESPRLEAELLLAEALGVRRIDLYLQHDRPLDQAERDAFRPLVVRRSQGEPTAYILGRREFMSLEMAVEPGVLIPRPETEELVAAILERIPPAQRVLELGTGSGGVAISVAQYASQLVDLVATDISQKAIDVAKSNARRHGHDDISFLVADLFGPLSPGERFDVIAMNPPYVATGEMATLPREVGEYEPHRALDGGADGLAVIRRLVAEAADYLKPEGGLCFEIGADQRAAVEALLAGQASLELVQVRRDLAGRPRVVVARKA